MRDRRVLRRFAALGFISAIAFSCGGTADSTSVAVETVASITLTPPSTSLAVRQAEQVVPAFYDANGRLLIDISGATWESSDPSTVAIGQDGVITGAKLGGPVTITASRNGVVGSATVSVAPIVQLTPSGSTVGVNQSVTFGVTFLDWFGAVIGPGDATWSTSNPAIAQIGTTGIATGVAPGTVDIIATVLGVAYRRTVQVGFISSFDGTWVGTVYHNPVSIVVQFGTVQSATLTLSIPVVSGGAPVGACIAQLTTSGTVPVVNAQFSAGLQFGAVFSGQFSDSNTLQVAVSQFSVPITAYACSPSSNLLSGVPTPAATFVAARMN